MIYRNARPMNRPSRRTALQRRFEWTEFIDSESETMEQIKERFDFDKKETRIDSFFMLPGRRNQITTMNDNETFEIKTLVEEDGPLELWETTVKCKVPMRRTQAQTIAARIPKFSGAVVGAMNPEELVEGLKAKTRYYKVKCERDVFKRGDVTAHISSTHIGDKTKIAITFESPRAQPLLEELRALKLKPHANTNIGAYLLDNA